MLTPYRGKEVAGRTCTTCDNYKPSDGFHKYEGNKLRSECKECAREKQYARDAEKRKNHDAEYYASRMATQAIQRCKNNAETYYTRNEVKCLFSSHQELKEYLLAHFREEIVLISKEGNTPSIDRINPEGNYEVGNIRVIDYATNTALGRMTFAINNSKAIESRSPDGTIRRFDSVKDAAHHLGKARKTVRHYANNGGKTRDGYSFRFI